MKTYHILLILLALFVVSDVATAGTILPRRQSRSISISYSEGTIPASDSVAAVAFEPFSQTLQVSRPQPLQPTLDLVKATQESQINSESLIANGGVELGLSNTFSDESSLSDFSVTFRILQPVTFDLSVQLAWSEVAPDPVSVSPWVKFSSSDGTVIFQSDPVAVTDGTPVSLAPVGTLPPGEYTLEAHAGAAVFATSGLLKTYAVALNVTPNGPPVPGFGTVYQLNGGFQAMTGKSEITKSEFTKGEAARGEGGKGEAGKSQAGKSEAGKSEAGKSEAQRIERISNMRLTAVDIVNLAMNQPAALVPRHQFLALVSDRLDQSLRLVVWDTRMSAVVAELGLIVPRQKFSQDKVFVSVADWSVAQTGRLLASFGGIESVVALVTRGTIDRPATGLSAVDRLKVESAIGQLAVSDIGGKAIPVLITKGELVTSRKLGTTP